VFAALPATFDLVRVGLALHGLLPGLSGSEFDLRPVLSLRSQVIFLKDVQAGTSLGYGRTYRTPRAIRVATIPMGYNDGLPLGLSNQGRVLVGGRFAPVIGAVSMDYTTLDVGAISGVQVGDAVTIVGRDGEQSIGLPDLARWAETIPHEILCSIGKRVTRIYHSAVPRVQAAAH
jgi:alanine racemase